MSKKMMLLVGSSGMVFGWLATCHDVVIHVSELTQFVAGLRTLGIA